MAFRAGAGGTSSSDSGATVRTPQALQRTRFPPSAAATRSGFPQPPHAKLIGLGSAMSLLGVRPHARRRLIPRSIHVFARRWTTSVVGDPAAVLNSVGRFFPSGSKHSVMVSPSNL